MNRSRRTILAIFIWIAAIVVASFFDRSAALWTHQFPYGAGFLASHRWIEEVLKIPGEYYCAIAVAILVGLLHPLRRRAALFVIVATAVSGINWLIKWLVGRTRPFKLPDYAPGTHLLLPDPFKLEPMRGGLWGLLQEKNLSFPSGHATLAFATAAAVAILFPRSRWRWVAYALAILVAAERVVENAHWLSDTVAGAALGVGCVHLTYWLWMRFVPPSMSRVGGHHEPLRESDNGGLRIKSDTGRAARPV